MPTADEDPNVETVQERAARGEPDAVRRMAILAELEGDQKPDIRKPGMGEISSAAVERLRAAKQELLDAETAWGLDPLTSTEGLPPLPRRIPGGSYAALGQHLAELEDAPDILRGIADYVHDPLADLPDYVLGLDPGDLRKWADAIEALLR